MAQVSAANPSSPHKTHAFASFHQSMSGQSGQQQQPQPQQRTLGFGAFNPNTVSSSALAFGFGQTGASTSNAGWRTPTVSAVAGPSSQPASNRRKRRSSSEPEEGQAEDATMGDVSPSRARQMAGRAVSVNKRARKAEAGKEQGDVSGQQGKVDDGVDIGKMLAALPKPALLQMFNSLLSTQPQLRPLLLSLIPPPSLESFTDTLHTLESKLIAAIPQGRAVRQEYVWGRTRVPLEEYLSEARHSLAVFLPTNEDSPSNTFTFLHTLTASVKKVEGLLPSLTATSGLLGSTNPLVAHLVPGLINAWHVFITRLSNQVNKQGKIMSAENVRTRFRLLDEVCSGSGGVTRKAMEDVRERMIKEIGWLAGVSIQQSSRAPSVDMDEEL